VTGDLTRRTFVAGIAALAGPPPLRAALAPRPLPDIQFDVGRFIGPARAIDGVVVRFPPVFTSFVTLALTRRPTRADRVRFAAALERLERRYAFAPSGVMAMVAYGVPYFARLARAPLPRRRDGRPVLEEAVPAPTDPPGVRIERNDMLLVLRSDVASNLEAALRILRLPGLMRVTSRRLMFQQPGLPRTVAERHELPYAASIDARSPMWMGFADQQVGASADPEAVTFAGGETTARPGDRFDNGAILHLSHLIEDLAAFYAQPFGERVQRVFRSNPPPAGQVYIENAFRDPDDARRAVAETGRLGHLAAVQRFSRSRDGTPLHIRLDGAGLDALDVPDGSLQPKLHFALLTDSAERFARMRRGQAAQDLGVAPERNGIERFVRATRRQNFLVPPRRHRAFPLIP
jgi:hypothetical protein